MRCLNEGEAEFATLRELEQVVIDLAVQVERGRVFSISPEEEPEPDDEGR